MKRNFRLWAFALAVAGLALLPYLRVVGFELVNLDDFQYVITSPVEDGVTWANVKWALGSFGYGAIWMPVTWLSYMLDVSLLGGGAGVHHWVNVLLHAANAALLFLLLAQLLSKGVCASWVGTSPRDVRRSPVLLNLGTRPSGRLNPETCSPLSSVLRPPSSLLWAAALAALFWAWHPLRVEPVAWVASRKDVLSLFWELLALLFWVRSMDTRSTALRPPTSALRPPATDLRPLTSVYWALSIACFGLACMAKPSAMTFPVLAGLLDYLLMRRVRFNDLLVPFLLALGIGVIAQHCQALGGATASLSTVPVYARLANAATAFGSYCWNTVWPKGLAVPHLHLWPEWPKFLWPGIAICAAYGAALAWSGWEVICTVFHYCRSALVGRVRPADFPTSVLCSPSSVLRPFLFVALAWFLVAVLPTLGLANFGYHAQADRFTYLPAIGFSILIAAGLAKLFRPPTSVLCPLVFAAALVALGALSWRQAAYWRDDGTLFAHTVEVTGEANYVAQLGLAFHIFGAEENAAAALPYFERAFLQDRKACRMNQVFYVLVLAHAGRLAEAKAEARDFCEWGDQGANQDIEQVNINSDPLERGARAKADFSLMTRECYAVIAYYEGDRALAKEHAEGVVRRVKASQVSNYLLGLLAVEEKNPQRAIEHWRICVKGSPLFHFLKKRIAELEAIYNP